MLNYLLFLNVEKLTYFKAFLLVVQYLYVSSD
jgi:hypothetical protein